MIVNCIFELCIYLYKNTVIYHCTKYNTINYLKNHTQAFYCLEKRMNIKI